MILLSYTIWSKQAIWTRLQVLGTYRILRKSDFFLATKCGLIAILVGYECTSELRVKTICRGQGSVPLVNKYKSLQSWELYISTSLGMRSCLKSGPVCALYIALHMLRTDVFCITSS